MSAHFRSIPLAVCFLLTIAKGDSLRRRMCCSERTPRQPFPFMRLGLMGSPDNDDKPQAAIPDFVSPFFRLFSRVFLALRWHFLQVQSHTQLFLCFHIMLWKGELSSDLQCGPETALRDMAGHPFLCPDVEHGAKVCACPSW